MLMTARMTHPAFWAVNGAMDALNAPCRRRSAAPVC